MSYSPSGSLLADGKISATYSDRGRLKTITNPAGSTDTTTYFTNALGQRVKKSGPATIVTSGINYYVYDDAGHLLGEYNASGKPLQETVYLGDTPVAVLTQSIAGTAPSQVTSTNLHYVYADHLGTARVITRAIDNKMVWRWDNADPFGMLAPDSNPSQLGAFTYNPRFPGQVYDRESGLFYNYFRDYDPATGRYVESDPIGLKGGINSYGYVEGNPLSFVDPTGLKPQDNWHGYNDKNFRDWAHQQKQDIGKRGDDNFTKKDLDELYKDWETQGRPRGKGGKSGKGGRIRGLSPLFILELTCNVMRVMDPSNPICTPQPKNECEI